MSSSSPTAGEASQAFDAAADQVSKNTMYLLPMWMANWAKNLGRAKDGESLDKLFQRPPSERVLVVGRGPSIRKHGHLELLAKHPFPGTILASDGAVPLLCQHGVVPHLSMTVDGSELIAKWFEGPSARYGGKLKVVLPVTVHPKTVSQCLGIGAHIYWYIPDLNHEPMKGITEVLQLQTVSATNPGGLSRHNGAGNAGLSAIVLAITILRAKEVVLIGMDNGYPPDTPLQELHYHKGMMKSSGYNDQEVAKLYRTYYHPKLGYTVVDPVFEIYLRTFKALAQAATNGGVKVFNCTEGGCLADDDGAATKTVEVLPFNDYLARV